MNKIHFILASTEDHCDIVRLIFNEMNLNRSKFDLPENDNLYKKVCKTGYHLDSDDIRFIKQTLQVALPQELRESILDKIFPQVLGKSESEFSKDLYLSETQIKSMLSDGMHIGSHGHNHFWLNHLSKEEQTIEIKKSVQFLERFDIDKNYYSICYPYGGFNDDTLGIGKEFGFKMGVSTKQAVADIDSDNILALPRLDTNDLPKESTAKPNQWFL